MFRLVHPLAATRRRNEWQVAAVGVDTVGDQPVNWRRVVLTHGVASLMTWRPSARQRRARSRRPAGPLPPAPREARPRGAARARLPPRASGAAPAWHPPGPRAVPWRASAPLAGRRATWAGGRPPVGSEAAAREPRCRGGRRSPADRRDETP